MRQRPVGERPGEQRRTPVALVDLPLAWVRRHVRGGEGLPAHAEQLAADSTALLLSDLPVSAVRARA
ncbi:hypothetical protein [Streptomyces sp. NPDC002994]|uniref:hypothetical protein n=1 Tax=Streptomyces sp. NPDC002994 TaxID=3154441 RepID=UPI00339EED77